MRRNWPGRNIPKPPITGNGRTANARRAPLQLAVASGGSPPKLPSKALARSQLAGVARGPVARLTKFSYAKDNKMNMKQNIALLAVISMALAAYATQPVISPPLVTQAIAINGQVQPAPQPPAVIYTYEQHSWPQSAPTHEWKGYVPTGYQPPANNAFDAMPAYSGGYSRPYCGGYCAPGVGLSVGFGIGGCSVGIGPCGISASAGLGCFPIGVGFGIGCY